MFLILGTFSQWEYLAAKGLLIKDVQWSDSENSGLLIANTTGEINNNYIFYRPISLSDKHMGRGNNYIPL